MTSEAECLRYKAEINGIEDLTYDQVVLIAEHLLQEYDTFEEVGGDTHNYNFCDISVGGDADEKRIKDAIRQGVEEADRRKRRRNTQMN